jgi:four helix bundle protein
MAGFKELQVWQKGVDLTVMVYDLTKLLPHTEQYGLISQMQRSAASIPSNIAEGYRRNKLGEYAHFCGIALGSAAELETQLVITARVYHSVDVERLLALNEEIQKMLNALINKLKP